MVAININNRKNSERRSGIESCFPKSLLLATDVLKSLLWVGIWSEKLQSFHGVESVFNFLCRFVAVPHADTELIKITKLSLTHYVLLLTHAMIGQKTFIRLLLLCTQQLIRFVGIYPKLSSPSMMSYDTMSIGNTNHIPQLLICPDFRKAKADWNPSTNQAKWDIQNTNTKYKKFIWNRRTVEIKKHI